MLDKFAVENKTFDKITSRNRLERKLINPVALREAFINAVVHNDFSLGWPVVEFYSDRVTITSTCGLVEGLSVELAKLRPILEYIESHDTITPQEARKLTGKSAATARRYLTLLCDNKLLEPTGKTNTTAYKVIRQLKHYPLALCRYHDEAIRIRRNTCRKFLSEIGGNM